MDEEVASDHDDIALDVSLNGDVAIEDEQRSGVRRLRVSIQMRMAIPSRLPLPRLPERRMELS